MAPVLGYLTAVPSDLSFMQASNDSADKILGVMGSFSEKKPPTIELNFFVFEKSFPSPLFQSYNLEIFTSLTRWYLHVRYLLPVCWLQYWPKNWKNSLICK